MKKQRPGNRILLVFLTTLMSGFEVYGQQGAINDNEVLGIFNRIADVVRGPIDEFDPAHWRQDEGGMSAYSYRYQLAFTAYAVAALAERTPAWRQPYTEVLDRLIQKMLVREVWDYWLVANWGGENPLYPYNIMYSGHLQLMLTLYQKVTGDRKYEQEFFLQDSGFSTSLDSLAADLHKLTLNNVNSKGEHYYGISCETGLVFVPCNTPHTYGHVILDKMLGTDYAPASHTWLDWVRTNMLDTSGGYFQLVYLPFENPPRVVEAPIGVFNAWSLIFIDALDHDWTVRAYEDFKTVFVDIDALGPGTAIVRNVPGDDNPEWDILATAFGTVLAREMGDQEYYGKYVAALDALLGAPEWSDDDRSFGYQTPQMPTIWINCFMLWARTLGDGYNMRTNVERPWSEAHFALPYVAEMSNEAAFVNQAFFDSTAGALTVTVSGGAATSEPTAIVIDNLDPAIAYAVTLDGAQYNEWERNGTKLVVKTPHLTAARQSFVVTADRQTALVEPPAAAPISFRLRQSYPNPFNPTTTISFTLPATSEVTVTIFNILGEHIATLVEKSLPVGEHHYTWQAEDLPSGVYLYTLTAGRFRETKKMVLAK